MVQDWPEVRECHMVRGGGDFLLKLVAHSKAHENQITTKLTSSRGVVRVTTFPVIRTAKELPGVPVELDRAEEHPTELQSLMRSSYADLGLKKNTNKRTINRNHGEN